MSILAGIIGFNKFKDTNKKALIENRKKEDEAKAPTPERVESILPLDIMDLDVGYELIPLVDADSNGELLV